MDIFELHYPGTWIEAVQNQHQVTTLLYQLESQLADAAMGLILFNNARSRPRSEPGWLRRKDRSREIARRMEADLPANLTPGENHTRLREIPKAASLEASRNDWANGALPDSYEHRLPFIHAHTAVYALDSIGKILKALSGMGLPVGVTDALNDYRSMLPNLVAVRDSAHHSEDRARGLDRNHQPLTLQPINNAMISAPNGGVLALSNLNGNLLGYTAGDGHYREVEISSISVAAAQTSIQKAIDSFTWTGPSRVVPN